MKKKTIEEFIGNLNLKTSSFVKTEFGRVESVGDSVAIVTGLPDAFFGEVLIFEVPKKVEKNIYGVIFNLEIDQASVVIINDNKNKVREGLLVKRTNKLLNIPVGDELLGRVLDPFANFIDGGKEIIFKQFSEIEQQAPNVMDVDWVNEPLDTGILLINSLIPIGKGQKELIIGDRQTGKTTIAIDTIINQKGKNVICVYAGIAQKASNIATLHDKLKIFGADKYTTIIVSFANDSLATQFFTPYAAVTIAEYWMKKGKDVLIIYDDLTKHANAYRGLSLLLKRSPGREAYPGDIFYIHSRLLERSAKLNSKLGSGSITSLPIIEIQNGDFSSYIPTNIISITDGQIFLDTELFNQGIKPAINAVGLSVSRVGSSAQVGLMKKLATTLKFEISQYEEFKKFAQFGAEIDIKTKDIIHHGERIVEILKQDKQHPLSLQEQVLLLFAIKTRVLKWLPLNKISLFKEKIKNFLQEKEIFLNKISLKKYFSKQNESILLNYFSQIVISITKLIENYNYKSFGNKKEWEEFNSN